MARRRGKKSEAKAAAGTAAKPAKVAKPRRAAAVDPVDADAVAFAKELAERQAIANARKSIEGMALAMLGRAYHLETEIAADLARTIAKNYGLRAEAEGVLRVDGLMCYGGKNGAPYANPMIAVIQKTTELIERLLDRLEQFKISEDDEPLDLDDGDA